MCLVGGGGWEMGARVPTLDGTFLTHRQEKEQAAPWPHTAAVWVVVYSGRKSLRNYGNLN